MTEGQNDSPKEFVMPEDCPNPQLYEDKSESQVDCLVHDYFVNIKLMLPSLREDGTADLCKVQRPACDDTNETIGDYNQNPLLNTQVYDVEDPDGNVQKSSANIIAEKVLNTCNHKGYRWATLLDIVGHNQANNTVQKSDQIIFYKGKNAKRQRKTTVGWKVRCKLSDGTHQWFDLKHLKQSNPVDVAQYALQVGIADKPAFKW